MSEWLVIAGTALGVIIYLAVSVSVIQTLLIARSRIPALVRIVDAVTSFPFRLIRRYLRPFERRDRILTFEGPIALAIQLGVWVVLYLVAFSLLLLPAVPSGFNLIREAGSSIFTLGFASSPGVWATLVDFLAAATGLIVITLQIAYLPTLYAAFNRRETEVTLLSARAGIPPWGPELLARAHLNDGLSDLPQLYLQWERWAADVTETHTSYPVLVRLRSADGYASWLISLLAICDSAALLDSVAPSLTPFEARLALRMGYLCLRALAEQRYISFPADPKPTEPLVLTREEFELGYQRLAQVQFPIDRDADTAWAHFQGWRINYEAAAYGLARSLDAVPTLWAGSRLSGDKPVRFQRLLNRTPDDPEAEGRAPYSPPDPT